jgi:t-SNARE complex subunit (syntaxin)
MESIKPFKYLYGDYEFYTGLIDVAEGYFLDGQIELAQNLSRKISDEHDKRLSLYNQVSKESQRQLISRIQRELSNFNYLVQIIKAYDSTKFGDEIEGMYNKNLILFSTTFSEEE